ncbi:hypothetical protein ACFFRR_003445 [Megaselia abdita]
MSVWKGVLLWFLALLQIAQDWILEFFLGLYWGEKKVCPGPTSSNKELVQKSAVELAKLIRERKVKCYDVVKAFTDRINETNGFLNAVVDGPFPEALEEAQEIDLMLAKGVFTNKDFEEKPFLGVPFTTKESTSVKDKKLSLGLVSRKNEIGREDAECVRKAKEAGAIIIGLTNVPEVNKWIESRNNVYGQTNNPYDNRRTVGGSSGGEACIISSCGTGFGIGTDIGGSIRIPAFSCGIFGHKPTENSVSMKGCTFRTAKEEPTMVAAGPMSRHAEDLLPLLNVLVSNDKKAALKLDETVDLKKLRYFYITENGIVAATPVNSETKNVMKKVTRYFQELTEQDVVKSKLPGLEKSKNMWRYWMTKEPANFNKLMGNGDEVNPIVELLKKLVGQSDFSMAGVFGLIDGILPAENEKMVLELTKKLEDALNELLGDDGILFFTSNPRTAAFHYYPLFFKFNDFHFFSIFNVLKVPVTQVPMGLDSNGLPLGIQVVATRNRDRHCIAVARELERAFGGWVPPFQQT